MVVRIRVTRRTLVAVLCLLAQLLALPLPGSPALAAGRGSGGGASAAAPATASAGSSGPAVRHPSPRASLHGTDGTLLPPAVSTPASSASAAVSVTASATATAVPDTATSLASATPAAPAATATGMSAPTAPTSAPATVSPTTTVTATAATATITPSPSPTVTPSATATTSPVTTTTPATGTNPFDSLPIAFEPNQGQTASGVAFLARTEGAQLYLTAQQAVLALAPLGASVPLTAVPPTGDVQPSPVVTQDLLGFSFIGANPAPQIVGQQQLPGVANYLIGADPSAWHTNIPTYARAVYQGLYPGIDLAYYGTESRLEYDFDVAPGADPSQIMLQVQGAQRLSLDAQGNLLVQLAEGTIIEQNAPVAYQVINGQHTLVSAQYALTGTDSVVFTLGAYDTSQELIIDPVLRYGTYVGGSGNELGNGIAVDSAGEAVLVGRTDTAMTSTILFPTSTGAYSTSLAGATDAFVTKLNASGTARLYSTFLGGSAIDTAYGVAVDAAGHAYVVGDTYSSDFPTKNAPQSTLGGGNGDVDAFVTELTADGSGLVYSTYLGGAQEDDGFAIALDAAGNAYVTGDTYSSPSDGFPLKNALQSSFGGGSVDTCNINGTNKPCPDAFVAEVPAGGGGTFTYSSYLGGSNDDVGRGIALDGSGTVYVAGDTFSTNFPTTASAYQQTQGANGATNNAFLSKMRLGSTPALLYSTFLGGNGGDAAFGLAVDSAGDAYVTGDTHSTNFPILSAVQPTFGGGTCSGSPCADAFVSKLNTAISGTAGLVYSTFLGGSGEDDGKGIALDGAGNAYVVGYTYSSDFPASPDALEPVANGGDEGFLSKIGPDGHVLRYSSYLGGNGDDSAAAVAVDATGAAYVAGSSASAQLPTTGIQPQNVNGTNASVSDAFVLKIPTVPQPGWNWRTNLTTLPGPPASGLAVTAGLDGKIYAAGGTDGTSTDYATANVYNPTSGTWSALPNLPAARDEARAVTLADGTIVVLGGGTGCHFTLNCSFYNTVYAYTPGVDTQWRTLAPMLTPRYRFTAVVRDNKIYAIGGYTGTQTTSSVDVYDPASNTWSAGPNLPTAVQSEAAAVGSDDKIYVMGGYDGACTDYNNLYIYNGTSWSNGAALPTARHDLFAALGPDGQIVTFGGYSEAFGCNTQGGFSATVESYDPVTGHWTTQMPLPEATCCTGIAVLSSGTVYIMGGNRRAGQTTGVIAGTLVTALHGSVSWHPHQTIRLFDHLSASVDLADGHVDVTANDLSIPGLGPDLTLAHTWDSAAAEGALTTTAGAGWLTDLTPRMGGTLTDTVLYTDSTGTVYGFPYAGAPTDSPPYVTYITPPGKPWVLITTPTAGYTLTNILDGSIQRFDALGRFLYTADSYGNYNTLAYTSTADMPMTETNGGGRALSFFYGSNGLLSAAQSPLNRSSNSLQGQLTAYGYDSANRLTTLGWGYASADQLFAHLGYAGTELMTVTTPYTQATRSWTLGYDAFGRVISITSPLSGTPGQAGYTPSYTTAFSYTPGLTQTVVVEGIGTSGALTHTYTLDPQGNAPLQTDVTGQGHTRTATFDVDHDVISGTDALGNTTLYTYTYTGANGSVGLLTQEQQPGISATTLNNGLTPVITGYAYDPTYHDRLREDKPNGGEIYYTYDGHHAISTTIELTGYTPCGSMAPSRRGRAPDVPCQRTPLWRGSINQYDSHGQLVATTDGRGVDVTGTQTPTATLDPTTAISYTSHFTYDAQGDQLASGTPPITTTLNGVTQLGPVTTTTGYDGDGNAITTTSANGNTTTSSYDHLGRLVQTASPPIALWNATAATAINAGGGAAGSFVADTGYSGGNTYANSNAIDTSAVVNPAPVAVYQSTRYGASFSYTLSGLTPNAPYIVRLHFAEIFFSAPGQRVFNVAINSTAALTNFDIVAAAGGANKAVVEEIPTTATGAGQIVIQYTGVVNNAQANGIEVLPGTAPTVTTTYDGEGNVVSTRDPNGAVTTSSFDPLGRLVATTNPVSGTQLITYTATREAATQDENGNVTRYTDNTVGEVIQVNDPISGTVQYAYDGDGQTTAITSGNGSATTQVETLGYDALNHVVSDSIGGPGTATQTTQTAYDLDGNPSEVQRPDGNIVCNSYDYADELTETDAGPIGGGLCSNLSMHYSYDAAGNMFDSYDGDGREHVSTFDADNRTILALDQTQAQASTQTITTTSGFDPDGNVITQTVQEMAPSPQTHNDTFVYNADDWRTGATRDGQHTSYGYDADGQQRTQTVLAGTVPVTTQFDAEGRTTSINETSYTSTFGYNPDDQPTTVTVPGGVQEMATYNPTTELTHVGAAGPSGVGNPLNSSYDYGYGPLGWTSAVTATINTINGGQPVTQTLTHDALGRLSAVQSLSGNQSYGYDANGNITQTVSGGTITTYTYAGSGAPDELTSVSTPGQPTTYYGYDAHGDTTSISTTSALTSLSYDKQERLIGVTLGNGTQVSMGYTAQGLRASYVVTPSGQTQPSVSMAFSYREDELGQAVVSGTSVTAPYTDTYIYGLNGAPLELLRQQSGSTNRYWYVLDGRGNVVALTDSSGNVVDRYGYDVWGAPIASQTSESVPQPLRYGSYWYDKELGWYWVMLRSYDPGLKRWLQPDAGAADGSQDYVYEGDDPIDEADPAGLGGLCDVPLFGGVACGIGSLAHGAYQLIAGDDISTLRSKKASGFDKFLAVVDLTSNILTFVPIAGEGVEAAKLVAKAALKVGSRVVEREVTFDGAVALVKQIGRRSLRAAAEGCACFPANTMVAVPRGTTTIASLHVGDRVLAEDPITGKVTPDLVQAVIADGVKPLVAIVLADGSIITATANHPFWVDTSRARHTRRGEWIAAGKLRLGDRLRTITGRDATVLRLRLHVGQAAVYTLTIERDHTFFVGDAHVLVHNCPVNIPSPQQAEQLIREAQRVGSALKSDTAHRAATFAIDEIGQKGSVFLITGGDGVQRILVQVPGELNDVAGRFEWILDQQGHLTHQFFVKGGSINGIPITP